MDLNSVLKNAKKDISPDEKYVKEAENFTSKLNKLLKKSKISAIAVLGGSLAKGTNLRNTHDADIFVRFDMSMSNIDISNKLEEVLKSGKITFKRVHGSRDYFQIKNNIIYEIVPVLRDKNAKDAKNVADMSPLHVVYFNKKVGDSKKTRDEIRLTKAFLKSARIYGAESYKMGFSGHVADLLIIKYGSFIDLVKNASKWKDKIIIDLEKHHEDVLMTLNSSKIFNPLIIVDPVQPNRNAAAAVSEKSFNEFVKKCKEFLKRPADEFFKQQDFIKIINLKKKKLSRTSDFFILEINPLNGKEDVIGSKVLKIKEYVESNLLKYDFLINWSAWEFDEKKSTIGFALKKGALPKIKEIKGPPITIDWGTKEFKKKHKDTFTKNGYTYARIKRKYVDSKEIFLDLITHKYIKERCKSIKINSELN